MNAQIETETEIEHSRCGSAWKSRMAAGSIVALLSDLRRKGVFDSRGYDAARLRRCIIARMTACGAPSLDDFRRRIDADGDELALLRSTLLGESKPFAEESETWRVLAKRLRQRPPARREGRVRIWCVGCGSGEEVFSLAILLVEAFGVARVRRTFELVGTDIDEAALAQATNAAYAAVRATRLPASLVARHFRHDGATLRVRDAIRALARFERHDLLRDEPRPGTAVVVCRHLVEQLSGWGRRRALSCILTSLDRGGLLLVGRDEHFPLECDELVPRDPRHRIFERTGVEGGRP
jgi:two-component system CheB/CheR fusion protein